MGSILDAITGGKSSEASGDLERALQAIQGVKTPTADEMKFKLQKLVQAGVLTPQQAKTFLQAPNAMLGQNIDQTGTRAQQEAIAGMLAKARAGGLSPVDMAKMGEIIRQLNTQEKGANDAVVQNQAARGALTGGETLAAQLQNNQNATANANELGLGTAANAYNAMLQELTSAGQMGQGLQGQENAQANTVAAATNAINQFNAAQQQGQENFNVQNENAARAANLENLQNIENTNVGNENAYGYYQAQLPQQVYEDELRKAEAEAGINREQANQATGQGQQNAGIWSAVGNAISPAFGNVFQGAKAPTTGNPTTPAGVPSVSDWATFTGAPGASEGGEIHDYLAGGKVDGKARFTGNNPKNDTVLAKLSPGEIVLPRTVTKNPEPDRVMAFLNRIRKPKTPHPDDVASVLHAMGRVREANAT